MNADATTTLHCTCSGVLVVGATKRAALKVEAKHIRLMLNPSVSDRDGAWRANPPVGSSGEFMNFLHRVLTLLLLDKLFGDD